MVAGYVWDFAADRGPSEPLRAGMRRVGIGPRGQSGAEDTSLAAFSALFEQVGFERIETRTIDVVLDFPCFEEYWRAQTPPLHPNVKAIAALPEADRARLADLVRAELTVRADGSVTTSARANAIKASVPR